ncbi:hypothetical protein L2748_23730 [Shewanella sairae]|uniref:hypothetical protein n=1 Tax=Shewanella sairae TaxID=190310 RepID=UPI00200FB01A|nr:hypothetical protein [Shewanella sairae]MCL1132671.1 hypothetical protein [Shewanella sairae]
MILRKLSYSLIFTFLFSTSVASKEEVFVSKVKQSFTIKNTPETEKEYKSRLKNIESILQRYGSNSDSPLLFIGNEEKTIEYSKKINGGTFVVSKPQSPRFFEVVYKVSAPGFNDNSYIRLNREAASGKVYELSPNSVKPVSSFKKEDRILYENITDKNTEHQKLLLIFANRLIETGICYSVISGAKYTLDSATLFCGDGMKYTQTLMQITNNKNIEHRVVKSYAVF